jgi:hypothetical protein
MISGVPKRVRTKWFYWRLGTVLGYVLIWGLVMIGRQRMPPEFPLFYSLPYGEEQLGGRFDVYWVTGWLGLVVGVNEMLGWWLARRKRGVLAKVLWMSTGWAEVLWLIALGRVWWLVGW